MSERLKELAEQAGIHFHKGGTLDAGPNGIAKFVLYYDVEKFVEFLLEDAALALEKTGNGLTVTQLTTLQERYGVKW